MSDLISRSALIEHLKENRPINWNDSESEIQEQYDWDYFINIIKAQPTAYDKDKVVDKVTEYLIVNDFGNEYQNDITEIVKGGGINAK